MNNQKIFITLLTIFQISVAITIKDTSINDICNEMDKETIAKFKKILVKDNHIDNGGTSTIFKYPKEHHQGQKELVIKMMKIDDEDFDSPYNEIKTMQALHGRRDMTNIDSETGCYFKGNQLFLIMEKMETALAHYLLNVNNINKRFKDNIVWRVFLIHQMVNELITLHNLNTVHADLKSENYFMRNNFEVVLADFGFSEEIQPISTAKPYPFLKREFLCGTRGYLAPEIVQKQSYPDIEGIPKPRDLIFFRETDIYALGITIFEMFFIVDKRTMNLVSDEFIRGLFEKKYVDNNAFSRLGTGFQTFLVAYKDLVLEMLNLDFRKRPKGEVLRKKINLATKTALDHIAQLYTENLGEIQTIEAKIIELQNKLAVKEDEERKKAAAVVENELNNLTIQDKEETRTKMIDTTGKQEKKKFGLQGTKTPIEKFQIKCQNTYLEKAKQKIKAVDIEDFLKQMYTEVIQDAEIDPRGVYGFLLNQGIFMEYLPDEGASILGTNFSQFKENLIGQELLNGFEVYTTDLFVPGTGRII